MGKRNTERRGWPLSRRAFIGTSSLAALAGCLSFDIGDDPQLLEFVPARPPLTLDPLKVWDMGSAHIVNQVVEGLYRYDTDLSLVPTLAADQPEVSRNGRRYVVSIDEQASFPGDDPVRATDVVYSYTTPQHNPAPPESEFEMIEDIVAIDETTVQFDLAYPYRGFPTVLTRYIVPRHRQTEAPDMGQTREDTFRLVGSGPFNFDDRLEDGGVRLTRWDNYWQEPTPAVAGVEFRPVTEGTKRVVTVKASEADVIDEIPPSVWETLGDLDAVRTAATPGLGYYYLAFNCRQGPTADPRVREAIDYAVDLNRIIEATVAPLGDRLYAPVPHQVASVWSFPTEEWADIPHNRDIDRAATILEDRETVPPDWEATFIVPPDDTRQEICEAVADGIRATGYRAQVKRLDWSTFIETFTTGDPEQYNAYCLGWIDAPDPDRYLHPLFGPAAAGRTDGTYYTAIANTIQAAREATTHETRKTLYADAIETMLTDRAHLPLYTEQQTLGILESVKDLAPHPRYGFVLVGDGYNVTITADE